MFSRRRCKSKVVSVVVSVVVHVVVLSEDLLCGVVLLFHGVNGLLNIMSFNQR